MKDEFERKTFEVEIDYDPKTGALLRENWKNQFGQFDRLGDLPAGIDYCPETGKPVFQSWNQGEFTNGPHRDGDKPARLATDPITGIDIQEGYMKLGHYHREGDKPAEITRRPDGTDEEHIYWQYGKKHRPPAFGPAVIRFDEDGNVRETEYWLNGQQVALPSPAPRIDI